MSEEQFIFIITDIQRQFDELKRSSTIPREIEDAFVERLSTLKKVGTGTATTQSLVVPAGGGTFDIPAQPSGTLQVRTPDGMTYALLYK